MAYNGYFFRWCPIAPKWDIYQSPFNRSRLVWYSQRPEPIWLSSSGSVLARLDIKDIKTFRQAFSNRTWWLKIRSLSTHKTSHLGSFGYKHPLWVDSLILRRSLRPANDNLAILITLHNASIDASQLTSRRLHRPAVHSETCLDPRCQHMGQTCHDFEALATWPSKCPGWYKKFTQPQRYRWTNIAMENHHF